MEIVPLNPVLGAELLGLDWSAPLADDILDGIHKALLDHRVLVARGAELTPEEHVALGLRRRGRRPARRPRRRIR